ncbi:hypothetical protein [Pseudoclavibacter helvolus]|uniref:hypothetical protein n=1 Tax=Pseudoclavibacter helvolus TaxID=255205 RepID=UPI003C752F1B
MTAPERHVVSRRAVVGLAWATPVVAVGVAAPAMAASPAQPVEPVSLEAITDDVAQLSVRLTATESLPIGTIFDVNVENTTDQWAVSLGGSIPSGWQRVSSSSRGARFRSTAPVLGVYEFVLGVAGVAAYAGTILTVSTSDGRVLTTLTL